MEFKPVTFHGDSLDRIRDFPTDARQRAGHDLFQVQKGADPMDWKPVTTVGAGAREIRISGSAGAFRVICIAILPDAIHVLHAFQKKTQKTTRRDLDIASARFRELKRGRRQ
jgi:phage-related protein